MDDKILENKSFNTFHGLVKDLSDFEKTNLLNKILKYSNDSGSGKDDGEEENISSSGINDKLMKYASKQFTSYSFFRKIFTFLFAFFNGISIEEAIINKELDYLKKEIEFKYSKYFNISENKVKPAVLDKIILLMAEVNNIKSSMDFFFTDKVSYYEFLVFLIENESLSEISECLDNLSPETLSVKSNYIEKNNYNAEKEKRIKALFSKLASSKYYDINKQFIKLEILFKIVDYDFKYLTNLFSFTDLKQPFSSCEELYISNDFIIYLERFYKLLLSHDSDILEMKVFDLFIEYVKFFFKGNADCEEKVKSIKESFVKVVNMIPELRGYLPYECLIKYVSGDILKIIKPRVLNINILEMYKTYKRTFTDKLWDSKYSEIKAKNIKFLVENLFGEYNFDSLSHFDRNLCDKLEKYSGLKVRDYNTLNVLYKFITTIYADKILPVVNKIMIDGTFKKDIVKSNFSTAYYSLKSSADKINLFDLQYDEDSQLRKKINNTLVKVTSEPNFKSILFNVITDINEDSYKIKFEIIESIKIIHTFFKSLKNDDGNSTNVLSNLNDIKFPVYSNVFIAIDKIESYLSDFMNIYSLVEEAL